MTRDELLERGDETVTIRQIVDMIVSEKPCGDCINRKETLKALMDEWTEYDSELIDSLIEKIKKLPPVTPAPKMGHWIKCIDDIGSSYYLCSACRCGEDYNFDFCPNCGSKNSE